MTDTHKEVEQVSTVASTVGRFVWHEQVSSDPKQAQDFYTQLFGWDTEVFKPGKVDYTMISSGGQNHGGFSKAMEGAPPPHWLSHVRVENRGETGIAGLMTLPDATVPPHWQPYVAVDDPDATTAKAKGLGGAALMEPMDVPKVGRIAVLRDPQGATFGIIKPDPAS